MDEKFHFIKWFKDVDNDDIGIIGEKAAVLGDMLRQGFPVPNGFIITPNAFTHHIKENKLNIKINHVLANTNFNHLESLHQTSSLLKKLILDTTFSSQLIKEILTAYKKIDEPFVSIKFSHLQSIGLKSSFIKTPDSILNIKGDSVLIEHIKKAFISFFEPREIFYRHNSQIDQSKIEFSLIIQKMIEPQASGIIKTSMNNKLNMEIKAIYGLGELLKEQDEISDIYEISKTDLKILKKLVFPQEKQLNIIDTQNKLVLVNSALIEKQKISDEKILELSSLGKKIENHYYFPQIVEWALENEKIYIIQSLPQTDTQSFAKLQSATDNNVILKASPVSKGIASGPAKFINTLDDTKNISINDILVIKDIKSGFLKSIKKAAGLIFETEDKNIKILFSSDEFKIPAISNAKEASKIFKQGEIITVNGTKGEAYKGGLNITNNNSFLYLPDNNITSVTKLYLSINHTLEADEIDYNGIDGIGFINAEKVLNKVGIHPKKLIKNKKENDFISPLSEYLGKFCKNISPKPVIYQTLNLTTSEYLKLDGASSFEQEDVNPEIGFRGAFRYLHEPEVFNLELNAIKKIKLEMGINNISLMIPFLRTVEELIAVKKLIQKSKLERSLDFKLFISADVPSNIFMLENFIKQGLDGIAINYASLINLIMGTDKNNFEILAENSRHNALSMAIVEQLIKTAAKFGIITCIYNIPALTQDLTKILIQSGVNIVCVNPDEAIKTKKALIQSEKQFINK